MTRPGDPSVSADDSDETGPACDARNGSPWRTWLTVGGIVLVVAMAIWLLPVIDWVRAAVRFIDGMDTWGVVAFVLIYAVLSTLAVPITPMNIAAGLLFGAATGFLAALCGAVTAAVVSFLLARYSLHEWVSRKLACYPKSSAILEGMERHGWKTVLLIRLNPLVPASIKNYCFGVTDIPLWKYASATILGQAPSVLLYSYLGSAGHMTVTGKDGLSALDYVLYGTGLAVAVVVTAITTWYGKRSLDKYEAHARSRKEKARV